MGEKSPPGIFRYIYGHEVLEKLNIQEIPANEIILKPSLLKK